MRNFISFKTAVAKIKYGHVIENNIDNIPLLKRILDTAFNKNCNIGGYSKYYYRETTGYYDGWVNSRSYPKNRKVFLLSEIES